jgi:hypothetical protein
MATDIMLIALPLPQLIKIKRPLLAKLRLIILFLVGLTIVAVTLTRLLLNVLKFHRSGQSHNVANVEIFFAAFVANAPTIYGLLNLGRQQRSKPSGHVYLPDSWSGMGTKLGQEEGRYTVMSGRRGQGEGGGRRGDASDVEIMIVSFFLF